MEALDFIILTLIAGWAVCFHASMMTKNQKLATVRVAMAIVFAVLAVLAIAIKS